jgi:hypothetical protein
VKSWWGRAGLIGAAPAVLLGSGTVLFDRNGDGVDDGGLDLCGPLPLPVPDPRSMAHLVSTVDLPRLLLLAGFLPSPRSPPLVPILT